MDKLQAMHFFLRVAETKSFSRAARGLEISPSAISKAITAFEESLGFLLFQRSTRRLSLTPNGAAYLERCRNIVQEIDEAENEAKHHQITPRGVLKVALHPAFRIAFFTAIDRLLDMYPDIRLETKLTNSPSILLDEGFELLIRAGELPDSKLIARRIGWLYPIVAAAPKYLKEHGVPNSPHDLQKHRIAIPARLDDGSSSHWEFHKSGEVCRIAIQPHLAVRDGMGLPETVVAGACIARLYRIAFAQAIEKGLVKELLTDWTITKHPAYAVFPNVRAITPKTKALVSFISKLIGEAATNDTHR